jgi:CHAT domain-containing protein
MFSVRKSLLVRWKVSDLATVILMEWFYDHLLSGRRPHEALRQAQRDLREMPVSAIRDVWLTNEMIDRLARSRRSNLTCSRCAQARAIIGRSNIPFYWGAFICQGGPAPLTSSVRG